MFYAGLKYNRIIPKVIAVTALAVATTLIYECGEPGLPSYSPWRVEANLPRFEISDITVVNEGWYPGVYMVGNSFSAEGGKYKSYIMKYDGYKLTYDFIIEYEQPREKELNAVAFFGNKGWAAGGKAAAGGGYEPLVLILGSNGWREIKLSGAPRVSIEAIFPIDENSFWFLAKEPNTGDRRIFKYKQGEVISYPQAPAVMLGFYLPSVGFSAYKRNYDIETNYLVSTADGSAWFTEKIPPTAIGYEIERVVAVTGIGRELYLICSMEREYYAILKRTGPLGEGKYELVFLSNNSANFGGLNHGAFDGTRRGVFVGNETSLFFDGVGWQLEQLPYPLVIKKAAGSSGGGFWAYGENTETLGRWELLFHP